MSPTIRRPFQETGDDSGQDSEGDTGHEPIVPQTERGEERGHGDDGPDGEVDFAGREDKDRAESHEGYRRDLRDDRRRVLGAEEALVADGDCEKAKTRANPR